MPNDTITISKSDLVALVDSLIAERTVKAPRPARSASKRYKVVKHDPAIHGANTLVMGHAELVAGGFTAEIDRRAANKHARGKLSTPELLERNAARADKVSDKVTTVVSDTPLAQQVLDLLTSKKAGKVWTPAKVAKRLGITPERARTQLYVLADPNKAGKRAGVVVKLGNGTFAVA